jgi:hypothetical protein
MALDLSPIDRELCSQSTIADSCRSRPQFLDDLAPRSGMMPPPDSEMISPPITE